MYLYVLHNGKKDISIHIHPIVLQLIYKPIITNTRKIKTRK